MDAISKLRTALYRALSPSNIQYNEQELFDELMLQKPRLLKLLDVGPRNPQEQKEIESGRTVIDGKQRVVNSEFARLTLFLSQQLECSERYIASLLDDVTRENSNVDMATILENAVEEFHLRRRHLVDALRFVADATRAAEVSAENSTFVRLGQFFLQELIPPVAGQDGIFSLATRIFKQLQQLDDTISRADNARRGAGSVTVAPVNQGTLSLGFDILNARYDSLKHERRHLATILSSISRLGRLSTDEIKAVVEWLFKNPSHPLTYYFLTTILFAFDSINPESVSGRLRQDLASNTSLITSMAKVLGPSSTWKEPGLKATILLRWTMFLTEARHINPDLENKEGFKTEELETQVWNGVQGDAFVYLRLSIQHLQTRRVPSSASLSMTVNGDAQDQREVPLDDFRDAVLFAFESLVRTLITHASSELRKIKQRQEDIAHARDRTRIASARFASTMTPEPERSESTRNDIATFYYLIGELYSALPPERGLQFWGATPGNISKLTYMEHMETTTGRLPAFLQWAVWSTPVQDLGLSTALYEMLSGLAKGQHCSELAYNFMARGGGEVLPGSSLQPSSSVGPSVSWMSIFGLLEGWAASATSMKGAPQPQPLGLNTSFGGLLNAPPQKPVSHHINIGPREVTYAQSFLRFLSTVVKYSVAVRTTISSHPQFRAIPTLVSLIPIGVPLELKGAIFDALAAFCEPGAGIPGVEICKAVWTLMERLEVINVRATGPSGMLATGKGVELELEQTEVVHRTYPATIPFLRLLATLIHTSKRTPLKDRLLDAEPVNTVPETLGQPYRLPGIGPFSAFVIDNVFANIPNREYSQPPDRWRINDLCLAFIERSLASYNLESLVNISELSIKADKLMPFMFHPGYDILKRLLTNSHLQNTVLSYLVEGIEGFDRSLGEEEPFFRNTIIRVLRITLRALELQDIFLDVLVPLLSDLNNPSFDAIIQPRSHYTRLDQALAFGTQYIPAIAAYMCYPSYSELSLLSLKILTLLCNSISPSTIVTLIDRSQDSERISIGFLRIIGSESLDDVWAAESYAEESTGAGAPETVEDSSILVQAVRLSGLEFLIQNTEQDRFYPNIAHYFLFGGVLKDQRIQDPHALGGRQTALHALLRLLNAGVPRLKGRNRGQVTHPATPLFMALPGLAERCYRVIHNLCLHPRTSEFTTRYLRTREDFFSRQLAIMPSHAPPALQDPYIQLLYEDGSNVTTTVATLCAFLRLRSYIFNLVTLELHTLTNKSQFKSVAELLDILFGADMEYEEEFELLSFHAVGQSQIRIIDFLQSLMFDWADSLTVQPLTLQFFANLDLQSSIRRDGSGCEVIDRTELLSILSEVKRTLQSQGSITTPAHVEQLNKESTYILESCAVENHRRKVSHALLEGMESWKRLLDMSLMKCFDRLPRDRRENMLFDLLHVLPAAIRSGNLDENVLILLAETILSSITKLREDRQHQIILQSVGGNVESGSLPADRLYTILRNIVEGILDSNRIELVRGNLYAALINFIQLITSSNEIIDFSSQSLSLSLSGSLNRSVPSNGNPSLVSSTSNRDAPNNTVSFVLGTLNVIRDVTERLIGIISRDAIDGTEVWKTIAFMLLDALVHLFSQEKHSIVISALMRHGILFNFVQGLKESDARLQSILKPDPDDLNVLYVYEAKMSLFTRMSQTRLGAERLLDAQIIPILAQCDYLDTRPETDQSFMDQDSFLPSAIQRYHQLLMPALQVVGGMLNTLGNKHSTVTNQVLEFLSSHGSTLVILLKNESDHVSLGILDEIHLIVNLCTNVLPSVPKREVLAPNSGFGAIHAAVLNLATKSFSRQHFFEKVVPQTDTEMQDARIPAFGTNNQTRFDVLLAAKERMLRKAILAYTGAASEFTEPEITLLMSALTNLTRMEERGSHFLATVPTTGDALHALDLISEDISATLKQISDLGAELSNRDHIVVENIREALHYLQETLIQELDIEQKRSLICQEMERIRQSAKATARTLFDTMEMLLLLIWRHLEYYADPEHMNNPATRTSVISAMRLFATATPGQYRDEVGSKLGPLLQRISSFDINHENLGKDWQSIRAYIEIMTRRLRSSAGLVSEVAAI